MGTRSKQLVVNALSTGSAVTMLTVPTGKVYLIRNVTIANRSTTTATNCSIYLNGTTSSQLIATIPVPIAATELLDPWWVLVAGDTLGIKHSAGSVCVNVSGYELDP